MVSKKKFNAMYGLKAGSLIKKYRAEDKRIAQFEKATGKMVVSTAYGRMVNTYPDTDSVKEGEE